MKYISLLFCLLALAGADAFASVSVEITTPESTIPAGQTITATVTARDSTSSSARFTYQFTIRPAGQSYYGVMKDFYTSNTFSWTPIDNEGPVEIGVAVKSSTGGYATAVVIVNVEPRATGGSPVISGTRNPLVALYSAPPCNAPARVRVRFGISLNNHSQFTPFKSCNGGSLNFYIAGMMPSTTYVMQQDLYNGASYSAGPQLSYRTGSLPSDAHIPNRFRLAGPEAPTSVTYPFVLRAADANNPFATDLNDNVVWYLTGWQQRDTGYLLRSLPGGTFFVTQDDPTISNTVCPQNDFSCGDHRFFRELDMAGNLIRETNWTVLNSEMNNIRATQHKASVHLDFISHEGIRLPNGYIVTMVTDEQIKDQGAGPVDVLGDAIIVLDNNLQVAWIWDAFDFLNVRRSSVISGVCSPGSPGCPAIFNNAQSNGQHYTKANDWTHANAIFYDPRDGNFVISLRNQSWVVKVAYENGGGDGHVIWKLGFGGSFELAAGHPVSDWFSGQHNSAFQANGLLTLFDNNNPSPADQQPGGDSRGQAWQLDLTHMVATPVINFDLGTVNPAVGAATLLSNGNYEFGTGFNNASNNSEVIEFTPSGTIVYKDHADTMAYRSFRLRDMYTP